jgi:hypothetical protein
MADEIIPTGGKKRFQPHCDQMKIWQWLPLHQVCNVANVLQIYKKIQRKYTTRLVLLKAYLRKFEPIYPTPLNEKGFLLAKVFFLNLNIFRTLKKTHADFYRVANLVQIHYFIKHSISIELKIFSLCKWLRKPLLN